MTGETDPKTIKRIDYRQFLEQEEMQSFTQSQNNMSHKKHNAHSVKSKQYDPSISRRQIPRPEKAETFLWINLLAIFSGVFFAATIFFCIQLIEADKTNTSIFQLIVSGFALFIILFSVLCIRWRLIASVNSRDGMIQRLSKELMVKKQDTDNSGKQLKHLIESTNVCPWSADLQQNSFTYIGPQIAIMTGIDAASWTSKGFLLEHIISNDRTLLLQAFKNLKNGGFITLEYRIHNRDGKILWIRNSFCQTEYQDNINQSNNKKKPVPPQEKKTYIQGFMTDITEQKNVEEALHYARYAAEKASKTKSNFLASMSHELRTPLNSIIGFAEIMKSEAFGPIGQPQYKEYCDNIHASGKHLLDLINDILDFSKIEAGKFDVVKDACDLRDIFKSCEILLRERAVRSELALQILMPPKPLMLMADSKRLKQVMINLLTNSIKFTKSGGSVALEYAITPDKQLILSVKDTGIGIKPEDIDTIFEKFSQADSDKNRDQEGTGLGLSISKSLVEMHSGYFKLHSIYGQGTTIQIIFPSDIFYQSAEKHSPINHISQSSFAKRA